MSTAFEIEDDEILKIWDWCFEAYLQQGMRITFPKNTEPSKTYQWRFAKSIARKFREWEFDDATCIKFISIAVAQAKQRRVLKKGLAALHQSNMLDICHKILTSQDNDNKGQLESLISMKSWIDKQIGNSTPLEVLLHRRDTRSFPNIIKWYQASKISELFISLSRSCNKAVIELQNNTIEKRLLPSFSSLYLLRSEFLSESHNVKVTKPLFGNDWRSK